MNTMTENGLNRRSSPSSSSSSSSSPSPHYYGSKWNNSAYKGPIDSETVFGGLSGTGNTMVIMSKSNNPKNNPHHLKITPKIRFGEQCRTDLGNSFRGVIGVGKHDGDNVKVQ